MIPPAAQAALGLFVTATDTGAGKTSLLCRLIPLLEQAGIKLSIRKPVESGCRLENGWLVPSDAVSLAKASCNPLSAEQVCAYRLQHTCSPARAAQLENIELTIAKLAGACTGDDGFLLVEGAGGLYSPLARDGSNADLADNLGLPLLIVVEDRLGCINHALLTIEAAQRRHLGITALVINQTRRADRPDTDNFEELKKLTGFAMFRSGYAGPRESRQKDIAALAEHLLGTIRGHKK